MESLWDNINEEDRKRIDFLRAELTRHNHNYYVLNSPEIGDREFDEMMKELESLEAQHPEWDDPMSPTHRVGSDLTKGFQQVKHIHPMLSLGNTYSVSEVEDFMRRTKSSLMGETFEIVGELKFDGTSISLIYEHGRLVRAVTRGDGEKGDVVTENVKTIKSIPLQLDGDDYPDKFEIRGEIVLPWEAFERLNKEREFNEEPLFANPRNAASGTLKMQNAAEVARRGLDAYLYYIIGDNLPCATHYDNLMAAKRWGFKISEAITVLHDIAQVDEFISKWDIERKTLPVATDGLVLKVNNLRQQLNLGFTAKSPRWAIAYKFKAERALTRLQYISFEVGRTGVITPVANLDPVLLSGTIVKRASLHNQDIIKSLDIHDHDMVYVEKGGEIIPKITGVETSMRDSSSNRVEFITNCPSCGSRLERVEGEAAWVCPNKYGCAPQIVGRVQHFVGRRMMNIDGIGEETAELLFSTGLIKNIADIYDLSHAQLAMLDRFANRSAERVMTGIKESKEVTFDRVLFSLSIPYVGETGAKKIARSVKNIDNLMSMTHEQLTEIEDVGPRIAESIIEYFSVPENREIIERLRLAGLQFSLPQDSEEGGSDRLAGKSIVISGTFVHHSRDEYKALIEKHGGKNVSSISKKTDYVFAGANMGPSKLEKANALGIPIIDEDTFLSMIAD
ncbi:MAG: NAD-dependent DNA ligase LigA [Muribaculaceae bacterium]|nr:NAD-dependent DNA ligase LigA [Muribaculaceae bacterium]